jgi:hypothetical protein
MRAILEFDFDKEDSDDRSHFEDAVNGTKWKLAMWELDQWLRKNTKYAPDSQSNDTYQALQDCRDELHRILNEDNLSMD